MFPKCFGFLSRKFPGRIVPHVKFCFEIFLRRETYFHFDLVFVRL